MHFLFYNRGREYCFVFNCALLRQNRCTFSILTPIFTIFLFLLRELHYYTYLYQHTFIFLYTATSIKLQSTVTKVILIPVVQGKSYLLLLFSLLIIMVATKHYSTYKLFTAFVSKTVFYITNSSQNQNQVENTQNKRQRTSEDEEDKEPFAFIQKYRLLFRRGFPV